MCWPRGASRVKPTAPPVGVRRALPGRRRGRALRPGLVALLKELLPRIAIRLPDSDRPLDVTTLFDASPGRRMPVSWPEKLWLEIGFGGGEHLAWQAQRHPEVGLLGAEYFIDGIARLLRKVETHDLHNVLIFQGDGRDLLDALPEGTLDRVFILFPDPWPKTRHHKRRIIQEETLNSLAAAMTDDAELRLATDDLDYASWMLARLTKRPEFEWLARSPKDWRERPADWPPTRYELKARAQGRSAIYFRFRRRRRPQSRPA